MVSILVIFICLRNSLAHWERQRMRALQLSHSQQSICRCHVGKQLAALVGHAKHIFVLHAEAPGNINQRFESADHAGFDDLIAIATHVRLFMKMETNAMGDETDRLEAELAELLKKLAVNLRRSSPPA